MACYMQAKTLIEAIEHICLCVSVLGYVYTSKNGSDLNSIGSTYGTETPCVYGLREISQIRSSSGPLSDLALNLFQSRSSLDPCQK